MRNSKKHIIIKLYTVIILAICINRIFVNVLSASIDKNIVNSKSDVSLVVSSEFEESLVISSETYETKNILPKSFDQEKKKSKGEVLEIFDKETETAIKAILYYDNNVCDYYFFDGISENLIFSSSVFNSGMCKKTFSGKDFLIIYEKVIGNAYPANIVTIIDGKLEFLSLIDNESKEYSKLYYSPFGEIICTRGNGISIGSHNVIPYYWSNEASDFFPYAIQEISLDELKTLDFQNVVEDIGSINTIYQRDNGLVHINYLIPEGKTSNSTIISRTYVQTKTGLREYDYDVDASYGFYLECFPVTE